MKEQSNNEYYNLLNEMYFSTTDDTDKTKSNNKNKSLKYSDKTNTMVRGETNVNINNAISLLDNASDIKPSQSNMNIKSSCSSFFIGEPVKSAYGRGYILDIYNIEGILFLKIKLKFGYCHVRYRYNI